MGRIPEERDAAEGPLLEWPADEDGPSEKQPTSTETLE
jgi:hypothetical protein